MRISRPHMWMDACEVFAKRSTCFRGNVAACVVKDNNMISMGYNGPPRGEDHCHGNHCKLSDSGGCLRSVHAEENAISRARELLKNSLGRCEVYCTYSPCLDCAQVIFNSYATRFFYRYSYRLSDGLEFLVKNKVQVFRVTSAGYIISQASGNIVAAEDIR